MNSWYFIVRSIDHYKVETHQKAFFILFYFYDDDTNTSWCWSIFLHREEKEDSFFLSSLPLVSLSTPRLCLSSLSILSTSRLYSLPRLCATTGSDGRTDGAYCNQSFWDEKPRVHTRHYCKYYYYYALHITLELYRKCYTIYTILYSTASLKEPGILWILQILYCTTRS